jgi:hypothetical protein
MKKAWVGVVAGALFCAHGAVAQDAVEQVRAEEVALTAKIETIRSTLATGEEIAALQKKDDAAKKAFDDAKSQKLNTDEKMTAADKAVSEALDKLKAMGLNKDGSPTDSSRGLSSQEKVDADAAAKAYQDASALRNTVTKEVLASPEIVKLAEDKDATRNAYRAALDAKMAADPNAVALIKERDELKARRRTLEREKRDAGK